MKNDMHDVAHCIELMTGKNLPGSVSISDNGITARIYGYDESFHINSDCPIFLRTENNDIVSLHDNIGGPPGHSSRSLPSRMICFRLDVVGNIAVVGHDAWTDSDRVRRATFSIRHSDQIVRNRKKFDAIGATRFPDDDDLTIYRDQVGGLSLSAHYAVTYGMDFKAPKSLHPQFSIEFDSAMSVHNYIEYVSNYTRFFSFCLGAPLTPSDFHISRLSYEEMVAAMQAHTYPGNHRVHYVWSEREIDANDLWVGGSPVSAWDDAELSAFRACLIKWMERLQCWRKAYALMDVCLGRRREISSERLVNTCRWFEEIPLTAPKQVISDEDINAIAKIAAQTATTRGLSSDIAPRITGAIKRIKAETADEQFRRLVKMVQGKFGPECLPDTSVAHLKKAMAFRGKTAHGHYSPEDEVEFRAFAKAIMALEALCLLLTAYDLPINDEGLKRMQSNPLIRDYRLAYD